MATYGVKPVIQSVDPVDSSYQFQKGEFCYYKDLVVQTDWRNNANELPSEQQVLDALINSLRDKGGKVHYLKLSSTTEWKVISGAPYTRTVWQRTFTVKESVVEADPFVIDDWLIALAIISIAGIILSIIFRPAIFKALGVTPIESIAYDFGTILLIIALIIGSIFVIGYLIPYVQKKAR